MTANATEQPIMLMPGELEVGDNGAVTQTLWQATYGDLIVGDRIFQQGWCTVTELRDMRRGKRRITADKLGSPLRLAEWPTTPVTFGLLLRPVDDAAELVRTAELAAGNGHAVDAEQGQAVLLCPRCRQPVTVALVVELGDQVPAGRAGVGALRLKWALVAHLQSSCRASARYAWVCDTDHTTPPGQPGSRAGLTGPRRAAGPLLRRLEAGQGTRWRTLYDEVDVPLAGRLVHSGRLLMADDAPGEAEFGPLDDLSQPDCGAGEIQYLDGGAWKTL
jgi:hypothetical protein